MTIEEGKAAPEFILKDQSDKEVSLGDYRGKTVVLYFYPKDNTPGCTKEAAGFRDLWEQFEALEVVVLGVSPDGAASHNKFIEKQQLPFSLLSDPNKEVMSTYGAFGEKMMYGKKTIGVIRSTVIIGPDGLIRKHWRKVPKAADHPAKVLEIIKKGT